MINFKQGVSIKGISPEIVLAIKLVDDIIEAYFTGSIHETPVITSINDSLHMEGSKHYSGKAFDLRTHYWTIRTAFRIFDNIVLKLKPLGFDVIFESKGTPNEHIHIEYDPKD